MGNDSWVMITVYVVAHVDLCSFSDLSFSYTNKSLFLAMCLVALESIHQESVVGSANMTSVIIIAISLSFLFPLYLEQSILK